MMGGDKIREDNQRYSTYIQDKNQRALTYGSDAGPSRMSATYAQYPLHAHNNPVSSDNLVVDLNQVYTEQNLLPDLNTIDMTSNMPNLNRKSFRYPWNLDESPIDAHKTVISDGLISEQINNLTDKKGNTSKFYEKRGGDISVQKNHEGSAVECNRPRKIDCGFLSLGIGDSTEAKSEYRVNWNGGTGEPLNGFDVQKAIVGSSGPGHSIVSSFNDHARSVYGSYANPYSSQFCKLQKTLPDMLSKYPIRSMGNSGIIKLGDTLDANLDHQKRLGGELVASSGQYSRDSSSGLTIFGKSFTYPVRLESVRPNLTNTQPSTDQLDMRYMQTVKSFTSESSTVSSATGVRGSSITKENTGRASASASLAAQTANKTPYFLKRKLVQPDGSIYVQFPKSTRFQASEGNVQGQLIAHSKNVGLSQASDGVGPSSRKRAATQPPPAAPRGQRMKTTSPVMPPVTFVPHVVPAPLAPPRVQPNNHMFTNHAPMPIIAPSSSTPPVQRMTKTGPSPVIPSVPYPPSVAPTRPPASTVQITNVTAPPPVLPSDPYPAFLAPTPLSYPQHDAPPATSRQRAQLLNIKVPSPVIPSIPEIPSDVPASPLHDSPDHHIKWQDQDELPPPLGERCMICKRDLLFTAEGPVFQPAFRPEAAVLPCGHTFHAFCLENITPADEAANPPCIPCAIGEI